MKTGVYPRGKLFLRDFAKHLNSAVNPGHTSLNQLARLSLTHVVLPGNPQRWPLRAEVQPDEVAHLRVTRGELGHRPIHDQGNVISDAVILDAALRDVVVSDERIEW